MRYIVVLAVIILFVRVDFLLGLFERLGSDEPDSAEIESSDILEQKVTIPLNKDQNIQQTPRENVLGLMEVFRTSPSQAIRERAMTILRENPKMFLDKPDPGLESAVYRWRELLINNEPEVVIFLLDLLQTLTGENKDIVRRFFSLWMDIDMKNFLVAYSKSKDSNCFIGALMGDPVSEEAKLNLLLERQENLKNLLQSDSLESSSQGLATKCLLVINLELGKLSPPSETSPAEDTSLPAVSVDQSP